MQINRPPSNQPIPAHAQKVFTGKVFNVWQWEQLLFNGKSAIFEKVERQDTVVVIPVVNSAEGKKILITRETQPGKPEQLGVTSGRVEAGEAPELAAARELLEETGYVADSLRLFAAVQPISKVEWAIYYFIGENCSLQTDTNLDGGEKISTELVDYDEFCKFALAPDFGEPLFTEKLLRAKLAGTEAEEKLRSEILGV